MSSQDRAYAEYLAGLETLSSAQARLEQRKAEVIRRGDEEIASFGRQWSQALSAFDSADAHRNRVARDVQNLRIRVGSKSQVGTGSQSASPQRHFGSPEEILHALDDVGRRVQRAGTEWDQAQRLRGSTRRPPPPPPPQPPMPVAPPTPQPQPPAAKHRTALILALVAFIIVVLIAIFAVAL
ncbi:hypothetical protein [Gordonia sp. (in: high G+C Gram-positive bacteria)]|uniref:hypothetical protein n=1 Tax=Gordonia sp. (in: high G+C Gram-positive bacteria) TaxID=84139 RepID=UPI003C7402A7